MTIKDLFPSSLIAAVFLLATAACSREWHSVPMKTYPLTDIRDGEYLHYAEYMGGEKIQDQYYVTRKVTNGKGGFYYRIYFDLVTPSGNRYFPADYTQWPVQCLIDPVRGCTLESEGKLNTNDLKDFASVGVAGLIYWHYRLNPDKNYVEYTSKTVSGKNIFTKNYRIDINSGFPSMDVFSMGWISYRFIDPRSKGIIYWVIPDFMKDPLPVSIIIDKKETLKTKFGIFRVNKLSVAMGDNFLAKLMEPFTKQSSIYVDDSAGRLILKTTVQGNVNFLEEISNVALK